MVRREVLAKVKLRKTGVMTIGAGAENYSHKCYDLKNELLTKIAGLSSLHMRMGLGYL